MLLVQSVFAGVNVLYKLAVNDGMNLMIMIAFRFVFASLFMLPLAFFLERNKRPKMTCSILFYGFLCGLFGGTLSQNLYVQSLAMTSATFVSAMQNLSPAITFLLALSFGMEKLETRSKEGVAKVAGTLVGIGGAMFLTFYKGIQISIWSTHVDLLRGGHLAHLPQNSHHSHNFVLGSLLALASCLSYSFWLILQTKMTKIYPCQYSSTALMCVMGAIQGLAISICVERDWKQWKLGDRGVGSHGDADGVVRTYERAIVCVYFQPSYASPGSYCWIPVPPRKLAPWQCDWSSADCVWFIHGVVGQKQRDEQHTSIERR
ncbi:WAT1-related protein At1g25270-like isoform X2 [Cucurbita moschata]|uniref:WAT1-related protein n=1 Tax=Cucurbita moschata TaxID=3662 RepID=A0A6J1EQA6_CUCMO|nr:WAT1-related protein At1g25270-like isoform X2 [Cucurbita moschata]